MTLENQQPLWRSIFSAESEVDERPVPKAREDWSIVDPVTREEVAKAIADSEDSSPGPDGVTLEEMKLVSQVVLASCYNLWLLLGYLPKQCSLSDSQGRRPAGPGKL